MRDVSPLGPKGFLACCSVIRYIDPQTTIGVIIGTGTNASYVEKADKVVKWQPRERLDPNTDTVINIE